MQPILRSGGESRRLDSSIDQTLDRILAPQAMALPRVDLRQSLEIWKVRLCSCQELKATNAARAAQIRRRISGLGALRGDWIPLMEAWKGWRGRKLASTQAAAAQPSADPHPAAVWTKARSASRDHSSNSAIDGAATHCPPKEP